MTDEDKERIKLNTEIIKLLAVFFLAAGGGAISLILQGVNRGKQVILTAGGIMFAIATGIIAYQIYRHTKKLIK